MATRPTRVDDQDLYDSLLRVLEDRISDAVKVMLESITEDTDWVVPPKDRIARVIREALVTLADMPGDHWLPE